MSFVELQAVTKRFGSHEVIHGVSMSIERGQLVVLVGPSGCGKSTILRMIAGLEDVSAGEIRIDGRLVNEVDPKDRDIAMVFQNYALYPDKTVFDNMAFGLRMRKTPESEVGERVRRAAEILGLEQLFERKPAQLSGGQRQRVAVGRAIVRDPKVFLFDEPLSNLDAHLRVHMRTEIVRLHRRLGSTMIYVTHDQVEAMTMGDTIAVLRDGHLVQYGSPLDLFRRPNSTFVASFIGSPAMNMLEAVVIEGEDGLAVRCGGFNLPVPPSDLGKLRPHVGREIILGIRPQDVETTVGDRRVCGRVDVVEHLGTETLLMLDFSDTTVQAVVPADDSLKPEQIVALDFALGRAHYFDRRTGETIAHGTEFQR